MRLFHQSGKILIGSELGINSGIVLRIIFVGGIRFHNGIQVNSRNAQLLQVGKLLLNALQISSETLLIGDRSRMPGHDVRRVFLRRPVAETVRKNLIPYRFVHPVRRPVHIGRVHPRHDEALEHTPFHLHLFRSQKAVLKIVPDLVLRVQLKIVFAALIRRTQGSGPPELIAEPFFEDDLLPFSRPFFTSSHNPRFIRVPVMQKNPLHIISCFQVYDQLVLVQGIAHLFRGSVIYSCKFHSYLFFGWMAAFHLSAENGPVFFSENRPVPQILPVFTCSSAASDNGKASFPPRQNPAYAIPSWESPPFPEY